MEVSGSTMEKVPSVLARSCWFWWPCCDKISHMARLKADEVETYRLVILEPIQILISLLTPNDRTPKWLVLVQITGTPGTPGTQSPSELLLYRSSYLRVVA
jgi:hypothetical protein